MCHNVDLQPVSNPPVAILRVRGVCETILVGQFDIFSGEISSELNTLSPLVKFLRAFTE